MIRAVAAALCIGALIAAVPQRRAPEPSLAGAGPRYCPSALTIGMGPGQGVPVRMFLPCRFDRGWRGDA